MYHSINMQSSFEAEKNKKAFTYTVIICAVLLLLAIFITWPILPVTPPLAQDLIEINLGNNNEGFGEEQPLIKGEMAPTQTQETQAQQNQPDAANPEPAKDVQPDDNAETDAAPVTKPEKITAKPVKTNTTPVTKPVKTTNPTPVVAPSPKPQKPKFTYNGPGNGKGNGAAEDNGFTGQGNKPGGKGDAGDPSGKPDSYGNNPGGKTGGPRVIGNRKIIKYYSFTGDLEKATVYAIVKVSPEGTGTFVSFAKNSSTNGAAYKNAIISYLRNVQFDKSADESNVTVVFNFNVN